MLAWVLLALHVTDVTLIEWTFLGWAGPWSWYSSWPLFGAWAFPPKVALSPLFAVMRPPPVTLQPAVLTASVQTFAASSNGSPASWSPSPLVSAKAWIASGPGSADM